MFLTKSLFWKRMTAPEYPPEIQAERAELQRQIEHSRQQLDTMLAKEQAARVDLLGALEMLAFQVETSHCMINTRTWDDCTLDAIWGEMKEKENALIEIKQDIRLAHLEIADAERTLADPEAWQVGGKVVR